MKPVSKESHVLKDLQDRFMSLSQLQRETADHLHKLTDNYLLMVDEMVQLRNIISNQESSIVQLKNQYNSLLTSSANSHTINSDILSLDNNMKNANEKNSINNSGNNTSIIPTQSNSNVTMASPYFSHNKSQPATNNSEFTSSNLSTISSSSLLSPNKSSSSSAVVISSSPRSLESLGMPSTIMTPSSMEFWGVNTTSSSIDSNRTSLLDTISGNPSSAPSTATLSPSLNSSSLTTRSSPIPSNSPRILIVDDDNIYRSISSRLLQQFNCAVDTAEDGFSALERTKNNHYDLILMDIVMPNLDGITTTRQIRLMDQRTPIISMTTNNTDLDCMMYRESGMTDILVKPFEKNRLKSLIDRFVVYDDDSVECL